MAKIRVDSSGISEIRAIMEQQAQTMHRVEQTIGQVLMNLDVQITATENIRQSLASLKSSSSKEREMLFGMSGALIRVNDEFKSTDHRLSEKARDVNYTLDYIIADAAAGFKEGIPLEILMKLIATGSLSTIFGLSTILTTPLNLQLLFGETELDILSGVNKTSKFIKSAGEYSEWVKILFGNEMFGDISDFLGDVGKNDFFKVAGYLGDGKKLVDALNNGDIDALEDLIEKYGKKSIKEVIKLLTGAKVTDAENGVYLDLAWNLIENTAESIQVFVDDPSFGSALSGIWNMTAGTFFDAGAEMAERAFSFIGDATGLGFDADDFSNAVDYLWNHPLESLFATGAVVAGESLRFVGDITGQGFDADDFSNAMDYLWNHPVESLVATGEVIADSVASFFDWLF